MRINFTSLTIIIISSLILSFLLLLFSPMLFIQEIFTFPWIIFVLVTIFVLVSLGYHYLPEDDDSERCQESLDKIVTIDSEKI